MNCDFGNSSSSTSNNGSKEDGFLKITRVKVPGYAQRFEGPETECPRMCLANCPCVAYSYESDLSCMFWNSTMFDIQKFPSGLGADLYVRVANSELGTTLVDWIY